jgi:hypothetical protein
MTNMWARRARPESSGDRCRHCGTGKLIFDEKHWDFFCERCVASAAACRDVPLERLRPGAMTALLDALQGCYDGARYPGALSTMAALKRARSLLESHGRLPGS